MAISWKSNMASDSVITITPFYVCKRGNNLFSPFAVFIISCYIVPHNRHSGGFLFSQRYTHEKTEMPSIGRHLRFPFTIYAALLMVSTE